jgi:dipeptidyl-peptidase 4
MMKRFNTITLLVLVLATSTLSAQQKHYTIEDLWKHFTFRTSGISDIRSMNDGKHFTVLDENCIIRYVYETGMIADTLLNGNLLSDEQGEMLGIQEYEFSADESKLLIGTNLRPIYRHSTSGYFYIYDRPQQTLKPLSSEEMGRQRLAEFSPDGSKVAFVRNNNLFLKDLTSGREQAITSDGENNAIINGTCDWVYEEEFSFTKGFQWSPSGRYIAFYRFDESMVKEFTMTYHGPLYPREVRYKYPKAGEDNSLVTIHAFDLQNGTKIKMDVGSENDQYIPRIKWTSSDQSIAILRLNRLQNHLEVLLGNPSTGNSRVFYEEKSEYYVDINDNLFFTKDRMVFTSEKSGFQHIHILSMKDGKEIQLTNGAYDVIDIKGIDEKNQVCYYRAAKSSPVNVEVYSQRLDGKKETMISQRTGENDATFSKTFDYYILHWSDANTPDRYSIINRKGAEMLVLEDNQALKTKLAGYDVPVVEFDTLTTEEGITLHYWMMKPVGFDPAKRYPVLMYVYGGPGSQTVSNGWSYQNLWFHHLTQLGYVVVSVDNRGTGHRGELFKKCTYLTLGNLETIDQIGAAKYFGKLPYIDASRIGIWGWSYGGYMSTLCMTKGADVFKTGIAVAPVTNWRYYDNIYTERFMRTPQENGEGYDTNSPINHVKSMKGKYLLIHGLTDDNVHVQNTYDLVTALVAADKDFELFIYPNRNHGIFGGNTRNHLYRMMTSFIQENL